MNFYSPSSCFSLQRLALHTLNIHPDKEFYLLLNKQVQLGLALLRSFK
jgi:hypothetical protein